MQKMLLQNLRRHKNRAGARRGFTLIEILMAVMLLSIGLSSIMAVFMVGLRASRGVVNESSAAIYAKSILAEVLYRDDDPIGSPGAGVVDTIDTIYTKALVAKKDWIWLHAPDVTGTGGMDANAVADSYEDEALAPVEIVGSPFSYRCRASRFRGTPGNPLLDLEVDGVVSELRIGRTPRGVLEDEKFGLYDGEDTKSQLENPDSDELWRLTIELFDSFRSGDRPIASFDTYICLAHR